MNGKSIATALLAAGLMGPVSVVAAPLPQQTASEKTTAGDRDMTQKIRKSIVDDKGLSGTAHNVKIITHDGKVTLRGRVNSEEEKKAVADKAAMVAGGDNVTNDLTVAPPK